MTLAFCRLASRSSSLWRRWKLHASATSLRQADRDGLLRRASAVLAFAYVVKLFANKFTGLRGWRFAFLCIFTSTFYGLFFRHTSSPDSKSSLLILTEIFDWVACHRVKTVRVEPRKQFADSDKT